MILLTAGYIQKFLKVDMEKQEGTIQILSILWFGYYMLSLLLPQYFEAPEAWDICAKSSLLFALLIFSTHKRIYRYRLCLMMMLVMLVLSGKEKAYGAIFVLGLFYYLIVHKKVQTKIRYILYMAIPVAVLAWDKFYYFYVKRF